MRPSVQVSEATGIGQDCWNPYSTKTLILETKGPDGLVAALEAHPIPRYAERFPTDKYSSVVTERNRERVKELDEIAGEINTMSNPERFREEQFRTLVDRARELIYGEQR